MSTDKDIIYYKTFLKAWVSVRLESDRTITSLAALALSGLLIRAEDFTLDRTGSLLWAASGLSFLFVLILSLRNLALSSDMAASLISDPESEEGVRGANARLRLNHALVMLTFFGGITSGVALTFHRYLY